MYAMRCIQIIYLTTETLCYENKQTNRQTTTTTKKKDKWLESVTWVWV